MPLRYINILKHFPTKHIYLWFSKSKKICKRKILQHGSLPNNAFQLQPMDFFIMKYLVRFSHIKGVHFIINTVIKSYFKRYIDMENQIFSLYFYMQGRTSLCSRELFSEINKQVKIIGTKKAHVSSHWQFPELRYFWCSAA